MRSSASLPNACPQASCCNMPRESIGYGSLLRPTIAIAEPALVSVVTLPYSSEFKAIMISDCGIFSRVSGECVTA